MLSDAPNKVPKRSAKTLQSVPTAPAEVREAQIEEIINVAVFDEKCTVHIGLPESEVGMNQQARDDGWIDDSNRHQWETATDKETAAVRPRNGQGPIANSLPKQAAQK